MEINLVPIGNLDPVVKREISAGLRQVFDCDLNFHQSMSMPENSYVPNRDQYDADVIVDNVKNVENSGIRLAITSVDIFYADQTFVFGLSFPSMKCGILSTFRLRNSPEVVHSKTEDELFRERVRKEAIHFAGLLRGLQKCDNKRCVMTESHSVREIDVKEEVFCGSCRRKMT